MNLDQIAIQARQRNTWDAIDLGIVLARLWYKPLLIGWMIPSLIVFILFTLIFHDSLWVGLTVTWWLKPLWDRVPLMIASRALFGDKTGAIETIRLLPKTLFKDWFAWLTWRRFSLTRSFDMPLTTLEGLTGAARSKRLGILQLNTGGAATWLTVICIHIEAALLFGALGTIYWLVPEEVDINVLGFFMDQSTASELLISLLDYSVMLIVAPFYTIAGFTLYISRRIELEGWDIEIRFRHLADRYQQKNKRKGLVTLMFSMVILPLLICFPVTSLEAGENDREAVTKPVNVAKDELTKEAIAARADIKKILSGEDFGQKKTKQDWRFKDLEDIADDDSIPDWMIQFIELLEGIFVGKEDENDSNNRIKALVAQVLEFMLWFVVGAGLLFLLFAYRQNIENIVVHVLKGKAKTTVLDAPKVLFGLDVRHESLPDNIPQEVMDLWDVGSPREALGLLYRATLSKLMHKHKFKFSESNTESECAAIVNRTASHDLNHYIQLLTKTWQLLAYGHQPPTESVVIELCDVWSGVIDNEN